MTVLWGHEFRCPCGALVAFRFDRYPVLYDVEGYQDHHSCPAPAAIDNHACAGCERPIFEIAGLLYDDPLGRIAHRCKKTGGAAMSKPVPKRVADERGAVRV